MENQKKKISVIIPAYNELGILRKNITRIQSYLESQKLKKYEIILVAQKSPDGTHKEAEKIKIKNLKVIILEKKGKWRAIKKGFEAAQYEYMFALDADLSYPLDLINEIQYDIDLLIGSRYLPKSKLIDTPLHRRFVSKTYNLIVQILYPNKVKDLQAGCKILKKSTYEKIHIKDNEWFGDTELIVQLSRLGKKIKEIPITYTHHDTTIKILKAAPTMLLKLLKY